MKNKQKRILIVRTDRVGDVIMITPMVRELRRTYHDAYIAVLTNPKTSVIFNNNPHLDACLTDDLEKETFWKVIRTIRKHRFTDALLVKPTERAAYQLFLAGIPNRIGVGRILYEVITFMKSVSRNKYIPLRHEADYCMDLARKIGVVTDNIQPEMFVTDEEKQKAIDLLRRSGADEQDTKIFIHTGTLGSAPNWNEQKYYELIKEILTQITQEALPSQTKLILTALEMSPAFRAQMQAMNKLSPNIIDISNELPDLRSLINVISTADIFICSSTGPTHIADALNIPVIALHCHRSMNCAKIWGILNKKSVNLEVSSEFCDNKCSPDKSVCKISEGLTINDVNDAINNILIKSTQTA